MKKIFIADHHPVTRKGISCMLKKNENFSIVGKASTGEELYSGLQEETPDILIMEIDMPNINGINALRSIKTEFPQVRVLIFSTHPEEIYALRSIKSGAAGYVPKTASTKVFLGALKKIAKGGIFLNEELTSTFTSRNVGESSAISRYKKLSSREIEVLNLLSSGKRNKDIANALDINEKTVSTYKTRLLKKLKVDNLADLIHQSRMFQFG
ncbi:MAG TPA: response regulator transcription factor [Flavobacteriaceae bacterium]|jgi:DNA-binding NarL/FixJ family response regulator|nr:DNA-binding response regulator [Flavobacteriaceae bacterium]MAY53686.1 DNA-binding response regulator [Flavobacteriaceae bacterium]HBR53585.1 DNA-binding response regulator [Flavobacteriaceae bacterium]HIB49172.1 response regulator transcription factor [Flavobacteriaceae bacterium]HIO00156.1 response regulator transcription factor [Flavobacteriaceae bacterium]|tara:strand:- start:2581 stop:3213 length:633 start_codon:yes stop_codon:yes gene_type:complete